MISSKRVEAATAAFVGLEKCLDEGNQDRLAALAAAVRKKSRDDLLQVLRDMNSGLRFDGNMMQTLMRQTRGCSEIVPNAIAAIECVKGSKMHWGTMLRLLENISFEKPKQEDPYKGHEVTVLPPKGPGARKSAKKPRRPIKPRSGQLELPKKELKPEDPVKVVQEFLDQDVLDIDLENYEAWQEKLVLTLARRLARCIGKNSGASLDDAIDFLCDNVLNTEEIGVDQLEILNRFRAVWQAPSSQVIQAFLEG